MDIQALILAVLPIVLGIGFIWIRVERVRTALKESAEAMLTFTNALEDKNITPEEWTAIMKESKEAWSAILNIIKK